MATVAAIYLLIGSNSAVLLTNASRRPQPLATPLVILPTVTPDVAALALMNATATVSAADANKRRELSNVSIAATQSAVDANTNAHVKVANADSVAHDTVVRADSAAHALVTENNVENAVLIADAQTNAELEIIEARKAAELAAIALQTSANNRSHMVRGDRQIAIGKAGATAGSVSTVLIVILMIGGIIYALPALNLPSFGGNVTKLTNSGRPPTTQRPPASPPVANRLKSEPSASVRRDNPIDFLKTARRMMIVGVTGTG